MLFISEVELFNISEVELFQRYCYLTERLCKLCYDKMSHSSHHTKEKVTLTWYIYDGNTCHKQLLHRLARSAHCLFYQNLKKCQGAVVDQGRRGGNIMRIKILGRAYLPSYTWQILRGGLNAVTKWKKWKHESQTALIDNTGWRYYLSTVFNQFWEDFWFALR